MAANSKRELIILDIISAIDALSSIATVKRRMLAESDLPSISAKQFPFVAVVGKMPKIVSTPNRTTAFKVSLDINIYCYAQDNATPDSTISSLQDDIWWAVMDDPERGGLAISTKPLPEAVNGVFAPYCAFMIAVQVEYAIFKAVATTTTTTTTSTTTTT